MALQSFTVSIGALSDASNNDKNYVSGEAIYVKTTSGTFAPIFRDFAGASEIAQDGLDNLTDNNGQFTFFIDAGDYILEYQNQSTPVTIVGPDYFNSRIEESVNQIIIDTSNSRGFRVVGDFASGFTYELANDVAIDGSGNYWVYADVNALPVVVTAGTTPSEPTYTQVTFNQASGITTTAGINAQQFIDNFELKIFQSPTDNLTKVEAFAGGVGVVYEVRKTADNSLAAIYSDKDGVTSITQNGIANVSNGDAEAVFYIADGDYTVTINAVSKGLRVNKGLIPFDDKERNLITCIPRVSAGGVLSLLDDVDHDPVGFSSAQQVGDFIMRINYSENYTVVNDLSVTIDDELCKYGVFTGASVGVSYSDFTAYTQLRGVVDTTDMTFKSTGLLPDGNVNVSYVNDVLIIDHDNAAFSTDAAVVTQQYGLSFMSDFGVGQSASQINIIPHTKLAGSLIYDGANFVLDPAKASLISTTQTGITYEWDGTVNALKITHPIALDYTAFVTPEFGGYTEYNVEVTSLSSFRVYFFDSGGNQITSPNTSMKLMFSRPTCQVRGKIQTGAKFNLRAGIIPVRSAALGSASGNNFFVSGLMQK